MEQKEYRITWLDEQGVPRQTTIFAFNMKPVLSTFFTHFPISTNVTAINEVVTVSCLNQHRGHKIWYNGRHWKSSQYGVEMSHETFDGMVSMIDRKVQEQVELARATPKEMEIEQ
jgi:hypothetical protein